MKLTFLGATHEVTGSCTYLEECGQKILIDCGMEQGVDTFVNEELPIAPGEVDMVLLTHAILTIPVSCLCYTRMVFVDRFLPRKRRRSCAISCFETVHTFRCSRQNGVIVREDVQAGKNMYRCTL